MTARPFSNQRLLTAALSASTLLVGSSAAHAVTYTWNQTTGGSYTFTDAGNWDVGNGVFVSGASNELRFYANNTTNLGVGTFDITGVPAALSMNTLTLSGRSPNNPAGSTVNIGTSASTWTIGDGTTSQVTMDSNKLGGGDRRLTYNVNPNIVLNQATTTFTTGGSTSASLFTFFFHGDISEASAGYGITKNGNSRPLILTGNNTYTGDTTITTGLVRFANTGSLAAASNLHINGVGVAELNGNFTRTLGSGAGGFRITGNQNNAGLSANGGDLNVTFNNNAADVVVWDSANFDPNNTLVLNASSADSKLTLNNGLDMGSTNRQISVGANTAVLNGVVSGTGQLQKTGGGTLQLVGNNTYGNTRVVSGAVGIETVDNLGTGNLNLNGGGIQVRGTTLNSLSQINATNTVQINGGNIVFDIVEDGHTFTADFALNNGNAGIFKRGAGTLVLDQANTFTNESRASGGGALVLDYTTQDNSKLSDTKKLTAGNTKIILRGGSHTEVINDLSVTTYSSGGGGNVDISRDGGTATIQLDNLSVSTADGGSLSIAQDNLATTDKDNNSQGILGGWATVGSNWAKKVSSNDDDLIVGLTSLEYTDITVAGINSSNANTQLDGGGALGAGITANTLRISSTADDQVLNIGTQSLKISRPGATGGLLYAGGANGNYTITGTTGIYQSQNNTQPMYMHVHEGTLTVDVRIYPGNSAHFTKTGDGTLVLGADNTYTGETFVTGGTLIINGNHSGGGDIALFGSTLGGSGTIDSDIVLRGNSSIAPGNSPGTLTLGGTDLIIEDAASSIAMEIEGTGAGQFDRIIGINLLDLEGNLLVDVTGTYSNGDSWDLLDFNTVNGNFEEVVVDGQSLTLAGSLWSSSDWAFEQSTGVLTYTVIPEPSSLALLALGGLMIARRRRG